MATPPKPDPPKPDALSERREKSMNDTFFENPVCPCEEVEPEPQSEYEVPGEWVTYTGEVNMDIFNNAAWEAKEELEREIRAYARSEQLALRTELSTSSEDEVSPAANFPDEQALERAEQAEHAEQYECSHSRNVDIPCEHARGEYAPSAPFLDELPQGEESDLKPAEETDDGEPAVFDMDMDVEEPSAEATGAAASSSKLRSAETIVDIEVTETSRAEGSTTTDPAGAHFTLTGTEAAAQAGARFEPTGTEAAKPAQEDPLFKYDGLSEEEQELEAARLATVLPPPEFAGPPEEQEHPEAAGPPAEEPHVGVAGLPEEAQAEAAAPPEDAQAEAAAPPEGQPQAQAAGPIGEEPQDEAGEQPEEEEQGEAARPIEAYLDLADAFSDIPRPLTPDEWDAAGSDDEYIPIWEDNWEESDVDEEFKRQMEEINPRNKPT